jgi:hypothetical protein
MATPILDTDSELFDEAQTWLAETRHAATSREQRNKARNLLQAVEEIVRTIREN